MLESQLEKIARGEQAKTVDNRFCTAKSAECERAEPKTCGGDRARHTNGRGRKER